MDYASALQAQFGLQAWQANNIIQLIDEGNTIPFIARYRKEAHGSLDDRSCARFPSGWSTCAAWKNGAKRSASSSRGRTA